MKFKENLDTAVFTTKYIIFNKSIITYVTHDEDGYWQFHGKETINDDSDIKLVSLGEILDIDKSIYELADLPCGYEAFREDEHSKWRRQKTQ